jgi:hypothetical protein
MALNDPDQHTTAVDADTFEGDSFEVVVPDRLQRLAGDPIRGGIDE